MQGQTPSFSQDSDPSNIEDLTNILLKQKQSQSLIELFYNFGAYDPLYGMKKVVSIGKNYKKQIVMLEDAFIDKETAESNAVKIMDYIYDTVDENILKPNGINLEEYENGGEVIWN